MIRLPITTLLVPASIPVLVSVPILQYLFAVRLELATVGRVAFPEHSRESTSASFPPEAILPILAMTLVGRRLARYMRAQVMDVLDQDFVRTAKAKGLAGQVVITRHVIRNAMLPIATLMGFEIASLFGGS